VAHEHRHDLGARLRENRNAVPAPDAERAEPVDVQARETPYFFEGEDAAVPYDCRMRRAGAQTRQESRNGRLLFQRRPLFPF